MRKKIKKNLSSGKFFFRYFFSVFLICSIVIFAICPFSCRMTEEGIEVLPGDTTCPVVEKFELTGSGSFAVTCSEKILISSAVVNEGSTENLGEEISVESVNYDETGKLAFLTLSEKTSVGENYVFTALITDTSGNSVEFQQNFIGFNENPAFLILSEVRTTTDTKKVKSDFVEFYCLKGGNTHGLKFCSGAKGTKFDYYFPAMEVETGEYITLHNKTYDSENAVSETGDDLTLSKAEESCGTARDLWREGTENKVGVGVDVFILENYSSGEIYDGLPFCSAESKNWSKNLSSKYAERLFNEGIWKSGSGTDSACKSDDMNLKRTISRKNVAELAQKYSAGEIDKISSSAEDWGVTGKKGTKNSKDSYATPGLPNSAEYYDD